MTSDATCVACGHSYLEHNSETAECEVVGCECAKCDAVTRPSSDALLHEAKRATKIITGLNGSVEEEITAENQAAWLRQHPEDAVPVIVALADQIRALIARVEVLEQEQTRLRDNNQNLHEYINSERRALSQHISDLQRRMTVTGNNSSHDHGNCELCDYLEQQSTNLQQRLTEALATVDYHNELLADAGKDYYRERRRADAAEASLRQVTEAKELLAARLRGMEDFLSGQPYDLPYKTESGDATSNSQLNFAWSLGYEVARASEMFTLMVGRADRNADRADATEARLTTLLAAIEQVEGLPPHTFPDTGDRQFIDRNATLQALRSSQEQG